VSDDNLVASQGNWVQMDERKGGTGTWEGKTKSSFKGEAGEGEGWEIEDRVIDTGGGQRGGRGQDGGSVRLRELLLDAAGRGGKGWGQDERGIE